MPTPIPSWDLPRRLVKFVGLKQINSENVTIRAVSRTLGIGRERIEKILQEKEITYKIVENDEGIRSEDLLLLEHVPPNLATDAEMSRMEIYRSYERFMSGDWPTQSERKARQRRLNKRERETLAVREFWSGQRLGEGTE